MSLLVMGNAQKGMADYKLALSSLTQALIIARQDNLLEQQKEARQLLASTNSLSGNATAAYDHLIHFIALNDSLFNMEKTRMINEIQTSFETAKKEEKITLLEQENILEKRLRFVYIVLIALLVVLAALIIRAILNRNKLLKKQHQLSTERFRLENESNRIEQEKIRQQQQREAIENTRLLQQQERDQLEKQKLNLELEESQRVILGKTVRFEQNRELMERLIQEMTAVKRTSRLDDLPGAVDQVIQSLRTMTTQDDSWEEMKLHFEKVHPHFFANLKKSFPDLTIHDLKMCAYIRMNISNKDISKLLNINPSSVLISKTRLKKKLNLTEEINLKNWIIER